MSLAQKLERLARMIPGVAGYQDKETSRDTDRTLRLRLTTELEQVKRALEENKRQLMEKKDLALLPALDRATSKLDKLGNLIKYASQGYRGVFDTYKLDQEKLEQLYTFDLGLLDGLELITLRAEQVGEAHRNATILKQATQELDEALDRLENVFSTRQNILTTK